MKDNAFVTVDGRKVKFEGEKNLLEIIRKAGVEIPTFCYHSELSVYGACRLCMVEIEGRGLTASCSSIPEPNMVIRTNTEEIRDMRKMIIELLLANDGHNCTTCYKGSSCQLLSLARRFGVDKVRFHATSNPKPIDNASTSLVRDPNKCILCGDCVRMCAEVQSVGAIDFAFRGSQSAVLPSFGKDLDKVECVYCGQCASVCPTGALVPKSEMDEVWAALSDKSKTVIAQVAPAVRVALGEEFGLEAGASCTGQIVAALKAMGFEHVYDTSFTADLTVIEEASEFLGRVTKGEKIPQFTSCCPGWVKFAEQYYPEFLPNLSSCRSPQQMFGSLVKEYYAKHMGVKKEDLVVVSFMPCVAKKFEAKRSEFVHDGIADVDHVISTQELARMIEESGLQFRKLRPESFDLPFGFKTGAGVIFGNSGGVSEAVLRFVAKDIKGAEAGVIESLVRGDEGVRESKVTVGDRELKLAIVSGLGNARQLIEKIKSGEEHFDFVEVMACPGGCIGGGGQPISRDDNVDARRTEGLYDNDKMLQVHSAQENPYITELYQKMLGNVGGHAAHSLLHTHYQSRRRTDSSDISLIPGSEKAPVEVSVCVGTGCYVRGAQDLLHKLCKFVEDKHLDGSVSVKASFCFETCDRGPTVRIGDKVIEKCTLEKACAAIQECLK